MKTIGPYQIVDRLGLAEGEDWFVARDSLTGEEVCLRTVDIADPKLAERFYQEVTDCGVLNHPNIFSVSRLGEQQGTAFVAIERIVGDSLRQIVASQRPVSLETKVGIMIAVAEALAYAHSAGILHRSIRPSNIFFEESTGRTRVGGFGMARIQGSLLTSTGHSTLVPSYVAPEQRSGAPGEGTDIFSASLVFYELVTGKHPFEHNVAGLSASAPRTTTPPPIRLRLSSVPTSLESAIMKGLAPDPNDRHASAVALVGALRQAQLNIERELPILYASVVGMRDEMTGKVSEIWAFLRQSWAQAMLKSANVDLDEALPRISAQLEESSGLHYTQLIRLQEELSSGLQVVQKIASRIVIVDTAEPPADTVVQPVPIDDSDATTIPAVRLTDSPAPPIFPRRDDEAAPIEAACPDCGGPKPATAVRCSNCDRIVQPRLGGKSWALIGGSAAVILIAAVLAAKFLFGVGGTGDKVSPQSAPGASWGEASIAEDTTPSKTEDGQPEGAILTAGTKVTLHGSLPEKTKWSLQMSVQVVEAGAADSSEAKWVPVSALSQIVSADQPAFALWVVRETCPGGDASCLADVETRYTALGQTDPDTVRFLAERYVDEAVKGAGAPCNVIALKKSAGFLVGLADVPEMKGKLDRAKARLDECSKRGLPNPEGQMWFALTACAGSDDPGCGPRVEGPYSSLGASLGYDVDTVLVFLAEAHLKNAIKTPALCAAEFPKAKAFLAKVSGKPFLWEKVARLGKQVDAGCGAPQMQTSTQATSKGDCDSFECFRDRAGAALKAENCTDALKLKSMAREYSDRTDSVLEDIEDRCGR